MKRVIAHFGCSVARESGTRTFQVGPAERVFQSTERLFLTRHTGGPSLLRSRLIPGAEPGKNTHPTVARGGSRIEANVSADKQRNERLNWNSLHKNAGACSAYHREIEPIPSDEPGEQAIASKAESDFPDCKQS